MADDFEGLEVVVQYGKCVLFAGEVVKGHVPPAIELLEGIKDVKAFADRFSGEALCGGIRVEVARLHVEHSGGGLDLRLLDAGCEGLGAQVEVAVPSDGLLRCRLAAKIGAQRVFVLAENARHKDLRVRQAGVGEHLSRLCEWVRLFHMERL